MPLLRGIKIASLLEQSAGCSMGFRKVASVDQDKYPHGKPELPMVVAWMAGPRSGHRKPVKAGTCLLRIPPVRGEFEKAQHLIGTRFRASFHRVRVSNVKRLILVG